MLSRKILDDPSSPPGGTPSSPPGGTVGLPASPKLLALRWFHAGQAPGRGKVRLLTEKEVELEPPTSSVVRRILADNGEDLLRFVPWAFSRERDGYVALEDLEGVLRPAFEENEILIRLEESPGYSARALAAQDRGFFGIGIVRGKTESNHGMLWRSASQLGAAFTFTVGQRYNRNDKICDTYDSTKVIPYYACDEWADFVKMRPFGTPLVGVEMGGSSLPSFDHPECCIYVLGAEDHGLPNVVRNACHHVISIPAARAESFNVAVSGSIIMYDRLAKQQGFNHCMGTGPPSNGRRVSSGGSCDCSDGIFAWLRRRFSQRSCAVE